MGTACYLPEPGTTLTLLNDRCRGVLPSRVKPMATPDDARTNVSVPHPSDSSPKNASRPRAVSGTGSHAVAKRDQVAAVHRQSLTFDPDSDGAAHRTPVGSREARHIGRGDSRPNQCRLRRRIQTQHNVCHAAGEGSWSNGPEIAQNSSCSPPVRNRASQHYSRAQIARRSDRSCPAPKTPCPAPIAGCGLRS